MVNVEDFEEFERWIEGKAQGTKYHYKASLEKFCGFHGLNPRKLINEVKNWDPGNSETSHLEEHPAERRLREWHVHLVTPKCPECGERVGEGDTKCSGCGSSFEKADRVSKNTASTYWRHIKAFYKKFGVNITTETPTVPQPKNEKPDYDAADVRKMTDGAKSLRDRAIILTAFQGGMDPTEICQLNYGQVKSAVEEEEEHHFIRKTRKKTGVSHHTPLLRDAIEALKLYVSERGGEIESDDPLFVKRNGSRITTSNIQFSMRKINERIGDQIAEARSLNSDINPISLKYLRRAFSIACKLAKVDSGVREYWMGHATDYGGAYSGKQIPKQYQEQELEKVEPFLSITTMREKFEEKERKQDKEIRDLREQNIGLRTEVEREKEMSKDLQGELRELYQEQVFSLIEGLREAGVKYSELKDFLDSGVGRETITTIQKLKDKFSAEFRENSGHEGTINQESFLFMLLKRQTFRIKKLSQLSRPELKKFRDGLAAYKKFTDLEKSIDMPREEWERTERELTEIAEKLKERLAETPE
ncbi:hypothetical protein AKJ49_00820 [candidate division MSBL1 archaeon SCGC-AAA382A03]|uniref:Tyr recombinase domain-containing protein n=1 Tax=candidate division MSBL1 archaeon SCGC-AAA382A03 TaxID=1698278 RepID=A0A133VG73_9EURY|nr:hypothetical protein AKJ49_00820 [candidate division MSBL1 archaeon SCGC-AAA382A03]